MAEPLLPCCVREAARSLERPRDVALCDACGRLLLAFEEADAAKARAELEERGVAYSEGRVGALVVIAKERA